MAGPMWYWAVPVLSLASCAQSRALNLGCLLQGVGTVIQDLCGGQYVSQVKAAGAPQSDTTQPFTLLTLDILPDAVQTISGAISRFTEVNTLEGEPCLKGRQRSRM